MRYQNAYDPGAPKPSRFLLWLKKIGNYFTKPQNVILLVLGIALTALTIAPMVMVFIDTFTIHIGSETTGSGLDADALSGYNWTFTFTSRYANRLFWTPFWNTMMMAALACLFAIVFGGITAYLITRTNLKWKKYISSIFILPYIMPQWTLANIWRNLFDSMAVTGTRNGIFVRLFNVAMPEWWCIGLFPSALILGIHYAPFAYILIGGIFTNMDANLEEAATILNTPKWKTFLRITLPMVKPAILSTILLVFSSAMGSYPVPHYLKYTTLATQYFANNTDRAGSASIMSIVMMIIGVAILVVNQFSTSGRKNYTTVTGKSGQVSLVDLHAGKYVFAVILVIVTAFTSIYPIISFTLDTFLENPGDYSAFTTKWWVHIDDPNVDVGMYGQNGILFNDNLKSAFGGSFLVAFAAALLAGTIGTLVGYCVSKNRKGKYENYVNAIAFLPYLLPSLSVGAAYFVFGNAVGIYDKYILLILVGTIKYIPFASRSALSSMLQLSGEIEESAMIQGIPWWKRMTRIIIPIQKTSIISGYLLPFITGMRELTLFMMLCSSGKIVTTMLDYYDEMQLTGLSSAINLGLIIIILVVNFITNVTTGASLDNGVGGGKKKKKNA